jgi:hypothetical protein
MSKQSINIGTNPNDGTGDTLRAAMDKVNDNTNEVYSLFGNGTTLAISGDATVSAGALTIANDAVGYDKLGAEFTTSATISASNVDWSSAAVFTKTLSANTTLTFSNVSTGMVVDLVITGNYTLTLPTSVKEISGTYDGTVSNLIQIVSTNGSTEQWATISQEA